MGKQGGSEGGSVSYEVYRSKRKTCVIAVTADGRVEVRAPLWMEDTAIQALMASKASWIERHLVEMDARNSQYVNIGLQDGQVLPLLGANRTVRSVGDGRPRITESEILLPRPCSVSRGQMVETLYRQAARVHLANRTAQLAGESGYQYARVKINGARTRWGSCSTAGNLNFSWLLILVEPHLVDYVILHELCHTKYMNHSQSFWGEVALHMPDYRQRRERLRQEQGQIIYLYNLVQNDKG